ncbi:MAG TPA: hypothetical protein VMA96_06855 [Solirubrobacteraceae bacterium]|nr:hypothetical protein [Solirubrobacteraceae bacterium]
MSLARAWGRELLGASSAALIVPSAMVAAVLALALGGAFDQVGVLGQLFAGPSLPGVENGSTAESHRGSDGFAAALVPTVAPRRAVVHPAPAPAGRTGLRPVTQGAGGSGSGSAGSLPGSGSGPASGSPTPTPTPAPPSQPSPPPAQPTPVDTVVKAVTSVTQQLPAPAGPIASQTVQAAGTAVDNLLPQPVQP